VAGLNVAHDPGTYLYNAAPPWDNALAGSDVHNTVTVDGGDQMLRAGRFLYLDWAQAQVVQGEAAQPAKEHPLAWSSLTAPAGWLSAPGAAPPAYGHSHNRRLAGRRCPVAPQIGESGERAAHRLPALAAARLALAGEVR